MGVRQELEYKGPNNWQTRAYDMLRMAGACFWIGNIKNEHEKVHLQSRLERLCEEERKSLEVTDKKMEDIRRDLVQIIIAKKIHQEYNLERLENPMPLYPTMEGRTGRKVRNRNGEHINPLHTGQLVQRADGATLRPENTYMSIRSGQFATPSRQVREQRDASDKWYSRRKHDLLPPQCANVFKFRKFIDREVTKAIEDSNPGKIRQYKVEKLLAENKLPQMIQRKKTTSAIFRDFKQERVKKSTCSKHSHTIRILPPIEDIMKEDPHVHSPHLLNSSTFDVRRKSQNISPVKRKSILLPLNHDREDDDITSQVKRKSILLPLNHDREEDDIISPVKRKSILRPLNHDRQDDDTISPVKRKSILLPLNRDREDDDTIPNLFPSNTR